MSRLKLPPPPPPCAELPKAHLVSNWAANKKLKVGFMTSDFRKHPMAYLFINMFRLRVLCFVRLRVLFFF